MNIDKIIEPGMKKADTLCIISHQYKGTLKDATTNRTSLVGHTCIVSFERSRRQTCRGHKLIIMSPLQESFFLGIWQIIPFPYEILVGCCYWALFSGLTLIGLLQHPMISNYKDIHECNSPEKQNTSTENFVSQKERKTATEVIYVKNYLLQEFHIIFFIVL